MPALILDYFAKQQSCNSTFKKKIKHMNHLIEKATQDLKYREIQPVINMKRIQIEMCNQVSLSAINTLNKKV